jgi:hypothetical protein
MGRQYAFMITLTAQYTPGVCETLIPFPTLPAVAQLRRRLPGEPLRQGTTSKRSEFTRAEKTKRIQNSSVRRIALSPCLDLRSGFNWEGIAAIGWFLISGGKCGDLINILPRPKSVASGVRAPPFRVRHCLRWHGFKRRVSSATLS